MFKQVIEVCGGLASNYLPTIQQEKDNMHYTLAYRATVSKAQLVEDICNVIEKAIRKSELATYDELEETVSSILTVHEAPQEYTGHMPEKGQNDE